MLWKALTLARRMVGQTLEFDLSERISTAVKWLGDEALSDSSITVLIVKRFAETLCALSANLCQFCDEMNQLGIA